MTKENSLFTIIGVLLGFIGGFFFANSVNQRAAVPQAAPAAGQMAGLPADHPPMPGGAAAGGGMQGTGMEDVQAAIKRAKDEPDNFDAQNQAARFYYQVQRFDEAIKYWTRANELRANNYEVMVSLGNANFDAGRFEEAEKWYTTVLAKKPDDVNVRTDLGLTFLFREPADVERAINEFRGSLQREPDHPQTLQNLAVALTRKGDTKEAEKTIARLEAVSPGNPALASLRTALTNPSTAQTAPQPHP